MSMLSITYTVQVNESPRKPPSATGYDTAHRIAHNNTGCKWQMTEQVLMDHLYNNPCWPLVVKCVTHIKQSPGTYDDNKGIEFNTLRPRQMTAVSQTTLSNAFSWMKMVEFRLRFHCSLFLSVQLTIIQHWFRHWLGTGQATSHYLSQWWLVYWRMYASIGINELKNSLLRIARFPNYNLPSRSYKMASALAFASGSVGETRFQTHIYQRCPPDE